MKNIYVSDDTSIATVNSDGVVTGISPGQTKIKGYDANTGDFVGESNVTVTASSEVVPVTGISLDYTAVTLYYAYNDTAVLTPTITPANATNNNITWSVSPNTDAVTCVNGVVKCNKKGTGNYTVTASIDGFSATCAVTVANNGTVINNVSPSTITLGSSESGKDTSYLITVNSNNMGGYNSGYTVEVNENYATISDKKDSSFVLNIKKNTGNKRTFTVKVQGVDSGTAAKTITVNQASPDVIDDGSFLMSVESGTTDINTLTWYWGYDPGDRFRQPGGMPDPYQERRDAGDSVRLFGIKEGYKAYYAIETTDMQSDMIVKVNSLTPLNNMSIHLLDEGGTYFSEQHGSNITIVPYYVPAQKEFCACVQFHVECPSPNGIAIAVPSNFKVSEVTSPILYDIYKPFPNNMRYVCIRITIGPELPSQALLGQIKFYRIRPTEKRVISINDPAPSDIVHNESITLNIYSNRIKG